MFVIYESSDEVIVTTRKKEAKMKSEWFSVNTGRDIDEFTRREGCDSAVQIEPGFSVTF